MAELSLVDIQTCFRLEKVLFTNHARKEMYAEEFGTIAFGEVADVIEHGKIIEH